VKKGKGRRERKRKRKRKGKGKGRDSGRNYSGYKYGCVNGGGNESRSEMGSCGSRRGVMMTPDPEEAIVITTTKE
jgi:hypothetical protein